MKILEKLTEILKKLSLWFRFGFGTHIHRPMSSGFQTLVQISHHVKNYMV